MWQTCFCGLGTESLVHMLCFSLKRLSHPQYLHASNHYIKLHYNSIKKHDSFYVSTYFEIHCALIVTLAELVIHEAQLSKKNPTVIHLKTN